MKITKQYLAGLIDGEGYLGLLPSRAKGLKVTSFEPVIKIGMTGSEVLPIFNTLVSKYGGHIDTRNKPTKGNRIAYTYILKSKVKVYNLLADIQPYLIIKLEQSKILNDFCKLPSSHTKYNDFNQDIILIKEEMYKNLKLLKQPPATTN